MLWRHLDLVRAGLAAGLVSGLTFVGASTAIAQTKTPAPAANSEPSSAPAGVATETVSLIEARKAGDLEVVARGHGPEQVHLSLHNRSTRRLSVVIPPGLVASSATGQPGGAGGGRGMQSMGLGSAANREGAFGDFQGTSGPNGLQSVGALDEPRTREIAVPVGETIELNLPAVCLNFGWPTPTGRDKFTLVTVDEYTTNPRIRKALRSLATYGTSLGVAQSVMWRVCNDLSFDAMLEQGGKIMNAHEVALAARFVDALDSSSGSDLVDPSALSSGRIFVQVRGEGALAADARRLAGQLDGLRLLGLPLQIVESEGLPTVAAPAMLLNVVLTAAKTGPTRGAIVASACSVDGAWLPLGKVAFRDNSSVNVLDGSTLSKVIDRAVAGAFVTVKPAHRTVGSTTLKVENRLPFTVTNLVVRAGTSAGAPPVAFEGVGVGPARSTLLPLQAATASLVERVEINGL